MRGNGQVPDDKPSPWVQGVLIAMIVAIVLGIVFCIVPKLNP